VSILSQSGYDAEVKAFAVLALLLGLVPAAASAAPHQTLSIVLHASNASTQRLPHYRAAAPIAVKVAGDASRFDALTVTATGPGGIAIRTPLARTVDGFQGAVRLVKPGPWTIALTAQLGSVSSAITGIPLDVVAPNGSETAGYVGFVLAAMMLVAGVLIIVRRREPFAIVRASIEPTKRS
jgi:hypothetical protein